MGLVEQALWSLLSENTFTQQKCIYQKCNNFVKNNIEIYLKLNEAGLVEQLEEVQWTFQENCDLWQYQKSYKRALVSLLKRHLWKNHRRSNWPPSLFRVNVLNLMWKWTCNGEILKNIAFSIEPMISTHNCSIKWNEYLNM